MNVFFDKIPCLKDIFEENGIDQEVLSVCTYSRLEKILSPKLNEGEKIKFEKLLTAWQSKQNNTDCEPMVIDIHAPSLPPLQLFDYQFGNSEDLFSQNPESGTVDKLPSQPNSPPRKVIKLLKESNANSNSYEYEQLMRSVPGGNSYFKFYDTHGDFSTSVANKVARLVISLEVQPEKPSITRGRFLELAHFLHCFFPAIPSSVWYTPYTPKPGSSRGASARGKLLNQYEKWKKEFFANEKKKQQELDLCCDDELDDDVSAVTEKLEALESQNLSIKQASEYWNATTEVRLKEYNKDQLEIHDYYEKFKLLKKNTGSELLLIDFKNVYPDSFDNLNLVWPEFREKILQYGKKRAREERAFRTTLQLLDIDLTETDEDLLTIYAFQTLALSLSSCLKVKGTKDSWKPTKQEAVNGFLQIVKSAADLNNAKNQRKQRCVEVGLKPQPYTAVVVDKVRRKCASYVYLNNVTYTADSPEKAIDLCFKMFHILKAKYPPEVHLVYVLLESLIYKLENAPEGYVLVHNMAKKLALS